MSLKAQRELQNKLHHQLYSNIHLLTLEYPTTSEFDNVFKRDMFMKNNKVAFHQVIYYLLKILDPVRLKQKIVSWPPYDARMESQFRNEVMKYLNELNSIYEDANVPKVMTSHLISPGGLKFIKFMLKLTHLVLYEHLKRNLKLEEDLLHCIKPSKDLPETEAIIKTMNLKTVQINRQSAEMKSEFVETMQTYKKEADEVVRVLTELNENIPKNQDRSQQMQLELQKNVDSSLEEVNNYRNSLFNKIRRGLHTLKKVKTKFELFGELLWHLKNGGLTFSFNSTSTGATTDMKSVLDLLAFVQDFHRVLDRKKMEFISATNEDICENIEKFTEVNDELKAVLNKYQDLDGLMSEVSEILTVVSFEDKTKKARTPFTPVQVNSDSKNSTLALPLESSVENKENEGEP